jgi:hypothetical protein
MAADDGFNNEAKSITACDTALTSLTDHAASSGKTVIVR